MAKLELVPTTLREACAFVGKHHRHNRPPQGGIVSVGAILEGELVGVAILGRPLARMLQDGYTAEVVRCCTDGQRNVCSFLYGAIARVAWRLGYRRLFTYTLAEEDGGSLRAAGWRHDADVPAAESWSRKKRPRLQLDLFGEPRRPPGPKIRWIKAI